MSDRSSEQRVHFIYRERRPFHAERLAAFLEGPLEGVLRVTGTFWVASRADYSAALDLAGRDLQTSVNGKWWAGVSVHQRPKGKRFKEYIKSVWHPKFGDRRQELIVSGLGVDEVALREQLERCSPKKSSRSLSSGRSCHIPFRGHRLLFLKSSAAPCGAVMCVTLSALLNLRLSSEE